jgi:short-subunit dehydrogenase
MSTVAKTRGTCANGLRAPAAGPAFGMNALTLLLATIAMALLSGCATPGRLSDDDRQALAKKAFVITGASSGIGRATALRLASLRANVVLAARRTEVLNEVAAQAQAAGGQALVVTVDVSKAQDMERLATAAVERFGRIDVWVNNAGVVAIGPFTDVPLPDHDRIVDVNLKGVIHGSHAALRRFREQPTGGTLINVGSVEGVLPLAYQASYSATKAGVLALGRALNEELRLAGLAPQVTVATVMPWATDTPLFTHAANYTGHTPQQIALDDVAKVADAIVHVSLYPTEEHAVGWKGTGAVLSHKWLPDLTERLSADVYHGLQIERAPPAPATSGNLHAPMREGTGEDGGVRQRMDDESRVRELPGR